MSKIQKARLKWRRFFWKNDFPWRCSEKRKIEKPIVMIRFLFILIRKDLGIFSILII